MSEFIERFAVFLANLLTVAIVGGLLVAAIRIALRP